MVVQMQEADPADLFETKISKGESVGAILKETITHNLLQNCRARVRVNSSGQKRIFWQNHHFTCE
jgi:hypothetical protein